MHWSIQQQYFSSTAASVLNKLTLKCQATVLTMNSAQGNQNQAVKDQSWKPKVKTKTKTTAGSFYTALRQHRLLRLISREETQISYTGEYGKVFIRISAQRERKNCSRWNTSIFSLHIFILNCTLWLDCMLELYSVDIKFLGHGGPSRWNTQYIVLVIKKLIICNVIYFLYLFLQRHKNKYLVSTTTKCVTPRVRYQLVSQRTRWLRKLNFTLLVD